MGTRHPAGGLWARAAGCGDSALTSAPVQHANHDEQICDIIDRVWGMSDAVDQEMEELKIIPQTAGRLS